MSVLGSTSRSAIARVRPDSLSGWHPWRRLPLYVRVAVVNTSVLVAAVVVLVFSPATVSFPLAAEQGLVLAIGVVAMAVSNAVLLRVNFRGLTAVVRRMSTLDLLQRPERLPEIGGLDARTLIAGFNGMVDRLESERRSSTGRTLRALEGERERISRELHDEVGQRITATLLQLRRLAAAVPDADRPLVRSVQEQLRGTLDEVGALAWQLRPPLLEDLGLVRALEALVAALQDHADPRIGTDFPPLIEGLADEQELAVYRIAQEALTNALRHGAAANIRVTVAQDHAGLVLEVVDDGRGMSAASQAGPGVRGMRERALLLGGLLTINEGDAGEGVRVRLELPRKCRGASA